MKRFRIKVVVSLLVALWWLVRNGDKEKGDKRYWKNSFIKAVKEFGPTVLRAIIEDEGTR